VALEGVPLASGYMALPTLLLPTLAHEAVHVWSDHSRVVCVNPAPAAVRLR
jgi:hypothetical protein